MERSYKRRRTLPAFELGAVDVDVLISKITDEFGADPVEVHIRIELGNDDLRFDNAAELQTVSDVPPLLRQFWIYVRQANGPRAVLVATSEWVAPHVEVSGPKEAWCAGVVEVVYSLVSNHRRWYSRLRGWPLTICGGLAIASIFFAAFLPKDALPTPPVTIGWMLLAMTFTVLFVFRSTLLPPAVLRLSEKDGWIKRHAGTIAVVLAVLTFLVNVIGLLVRSYSG
jgi:hypothetical protein